MNFLKLRKVKMIAVLLVIALLGGIIYNTGVTKNKVKASEIEGNTVVGDTTDKITEAIEEVAVSENVVSEKELPTIGEEVIVDGQDDEKVHVYKSDLGENNLIQTIDEENNTRVDVLLNKDNTYMETKEYKKVGVDESNNKLYVQISEKKCDLEKISQEIADKNQQINNSVSRYSWNKKHHTLLYGDIWYQTGRSSHNNEYLQIGRKASYRIAKWKLDAAKQMNCDAFVNAVDESNKNYNLFAGTMSGQLIYDICAYLMAAGGVVTILAASKAIIAAFAGLTVVTATQIVTCFYHYKTAETKYNMIKYYGEKL